MKATESQPCTGHVPSNPLPVTTVSWNVVGTTWKANEYPQRTPTSESGNTESVVWKPMCLGWICERAQPQEGRAMTQHLGDCTGHARLDGCRKSKLHKCSEQCSCQACVKGNAVRPFHY